MLRASSQLCAHGLALHLLTSYLVVSCLMYDFVFCFVFCVTYEAKLNVRRNVTEFGILNLLYSYFNVDL